VNFSGAAWVAVALLGLTAFAILLSQDWRVSLGALAVQALGVFLLTTQVWPLELALVKLLAGVLAAAVLAMACASEGGLVEGGAGPDGRLGAVAGAPLRTSVLPSGWVFRTLAAALMGLVVSGLTTGLEELLPGLPPPLAWGAAWLIGLGVLQLGFTARVLPTIMGLLTVLGGFELGYAAVEDAALVAGLLAAVTLGLALVGAYLLLAPTMAGDV
jgi:hypothetical protein